MNTNGLLRFFDTHRERAKRMALATVIETRGSTYTKVGTHMLIDAEGRFEGLLSGGCLEGDLAIRARAVLESSHAEVVTYELGADDDEIWGLGVGCDGMMRVLLQALRSDYEPFAGIAVILEGDTPRRVDIAPDPPVDIDGTPIGQFHVDVIPSPRLLVAGAGPDAEPLVRFAAELGWRCCVVDHRPAYVDNGDFAAASRTLCTPAESLSRSVDLAAFDMAIVMSHHLKSDRAYLRQLAATNIGYIGLLGPPNRRARLLSELGDDAVVLAERLHGPAGLDLGGRGPAAIALSIVAQMHALHYGDAETASLCRSEKPARSAP